MGLAVVWGPIWAPWFWIRGQIQFWFWILDFFYSKFRTGNLGTPILAQVAKPKSPKKWELNNIGTFLKMWDQMAITSFHSLSFLYGKFQHFLGAKFHNFLTSKMKNYVTKFLIYLIFAKLLRKPPQFISNYITKVWNSFVPGFFTILNTYIHKCNKLIFFSLLFFLLLSPC